MNKLEKSKNLEAARVLLIHARNMVESAELKIRELGSSVAACAAKNTAGSILGTISLVIEMQNSLENNRRTNVSRKVR